MNSGMLLWLVLGITALNFGDQAGGVIAGRVVDAETGQPVPCTVSIRPAGNAVVTDHPSFRTGFRSMGSFETTVPSGDVNISISRGFDFVALERRVHLNPGERYKLHVTLQRRSPLHKEGWYAGDNHDHMIHGERKILVDFAYAALAGRAEGLDYLALAQDWNVSEVTPDALEQACKRVSTPDFLLTWNLEAPKNYWRGDASKCMGHGWTVAMGGRTPSGGDAIRELLDLSAHDYESDKEPAPNFESHALIHELGGIVSYSHPCRWWYGRWGGRGIYPLEERKFISNMAAELPFDTVAGPTYDAMDILMQPHERDANECAQKLWFMLLNKGYHIAATGSSDATFDNPGGGIPGAVRTYAQIQGAFDLSKIAGAIRAGRSFVTSGPLVVLEMAGHLSGDIVHLSEPDQVKCRVRAWASGAAGEHLSRIELLRNGEVVKTFEPAGFVTEVDRTWDIAPDRREWFIARCRGSDDRQIAITNPVYFEPEGFRSPAPATAEAELTVTDQATGAGLNGVCDVIRMAGRDGIKESEASFRSGRLRLRVPATARLRVRVPGYSSVTKSIFMDYAPLLESALSMRVERLEDWATFEEIREMLKHVRLDFALSPVPSGSGQKK